MRKYSGLMLATAAILLVTIPVLGELLDRIVVVIDNSFIITLSDIRKERAIQTALGRNPPGDDAIADSLIERYLVEVQISQFREIEVPEALVAERLRQIPQPAGVSEKELRDALVGELRRSEFMMERFQQFIRVSDEELLKYYNEVLVPELQRRGEPVPAAEQGMEAVRKNVIAEKMDQEVSTWLADLRRRSTIEKISK